MRIQVEDAPFVITQWQTHNTEEGPAIEVISNLGHAAVLSDSHPLEVYNSNPDQPRPYVTLHRGLKALVHRNVFYQWVDIARQVNKNGEEHLVINSGKSEFSLGKL